MEKQNRTVQDGEALARHYRDLIELAQDLIWSVDTNGAITYLNSAVEGLLGYTAEELIGTTFIELVPAERRQEAVDSFTKGMAAQGAFLYETSVQRKDGSTVELSVSALIIRADDGSPLGVTGTGRDITDHVANERAARDAETKYRGLVE